jgi:hypothetical protein
MASRGTDPWEKALAFSLKLRGFRKTGPTWRRRSDDVTAVVNLQGSQWGPSAYVNLGVYFHAVGDKPKPLERNCPSVSDSMRWYPTRGDFATSSTWSGPSPKPNAPPRSSSSLSTTACRGSTWSPLVREPFATGRRIRAGAWPSTGTECVIWAWVMAPNKRVNLTRSTVSVVTWDRSPRRLRAVRSAHQGSWRRSRSLSMVCVGVTIVRGGT